MDGCLREGVWWYADIHKPHIAIRGPGKRIEIYPGIIMNSEVSPIPDALIAREVKLSDFLKSPYTKSITFVRSDALGDSLTVLAAARFLAQQHPNIKFSMIAPMRYVDLLKGQEDVDIRFGHAKAKNNILSQESPIISFDGFLELDHRPEAIQASRLTRILSAFGYWHSSWH